MKNSEKNQEQPRALILVIDFFFASWNRFLAELWLGKKRVLYRRIRWRNRQRSTVLRFKLVLKSVLRAGLSCCSNSNAGGWCVAIDHVLKWSLTPIRCIGCRAIQQKVRLAHGRWFTCLISNFPFLKCTFPHWALISTYLTVLGGNFPLKSGISL